MNKIVQLKDRKGKIYPKIYESGTDGDWKWEKYPDGKAICYGTFSKSVLVTSQWGNQYTGVFGIINFPKDLFVDVPITFSKAIGGFSCWLIASGSTVTKTSTENIACVRPNSLASTSVTINYLAIGRWKN